MKAVLVVLPNWYGDTLFATPLLRALREQWPQASVTALGAPACREVLQHNPCVNELIEYEEQGAHKSLAAKWRLTQALRARRMDTALILRSSLSRSLLVRLAGIPQRVGWARAKSGWLLTHRVPRDAAAAAMGDRTQPASAAHRHKAHAYLALLQAIGGRPAPARYEFTLTPGERQEARVWWEAHGVRGGSMLVVLHPGANWEHKRWPVQRMAQLADRLMEERGTCVALTGGNSDRVLTDDIKARMRQSALDLAGQTSLRRFAALVSHAALFISNDTGALHVAAAVGTPVVALYGPTSPALTGPLGDPARTIVLHHPDCCPKIPCYAPEACPHLGMASISVEEAYRAAVSLL